MKKMTTRKVNAVIASALALTLAIPSSALLNGAQATYADDENLVELPPVLATYDFEGGFKQAGVDADGNVLTATADKAADAVRYYATEVSGETVYVAARDDKGNLVTNQIGNQPTIVDDEEMGNVLSIGATITTPQLKEVVTGEDGTTSEAVVAKSATYYSGATVPNPFAGLDLSEIPNYNIETDEDGNIASTEYIPEWENGVTISYWLKAPAGAQVQDEGTYKGTAAGQLFQFVQKSVKTRTDDKIKMMPCLIYDENPDDERFQYTPEEVTFTLTESNKSDGYIELTSKAGKKYKIIGINAPKDYYGRTEALQATVASGNMGTEEYKLNVSFETGVFANYNKNIPTNEELYYLAGNAEDGYTLTLFRVSDMTGSAGQQNLYTYYHALYNQTTNPYSQIRQMEIAGFLGIDSQMQYTFMEDDGSTSVILPTGHSASGTNSSAWMSKNVFFSKNDEDSKIPEGDKWQFVTNVIKNDSITTYINGQMADKVDCYSDASRVQYTAQRFNLQCNTARGRNRTDCFLQLDYESINATKIIGTVGITEDAMCQSVLDWISSEDTTLTFGSAGMDYYSNNSAKTVENTCIDDIKFYAQPFDDDMAATAYTLAVKSKESTVETSADGKVVAPTPVVKYDFNTTSDALTPAPMGGERVEPASIVADPRTADVSQGAATARDYVLKVNATKSNQTGGIELENPFAGENLTGVTVGYWVKSKGTGDSVALSFIDDPKPITLPGKNVSLPDNFTDDTVLYTKANLTTQFIEGYSQQDTHLKNTFSYVASTDEVPDAMEWNYITLTIKNSGITVYKNGEEVENYNATLDGDLVHGDRFYDGSYGAMRDRVTFADGVVVPKTDAVGEYNLGGTNNQGATTIMEFLTREDTSLYVGYLANSVGVVSVLESYFDNISLFDKALTAEEVKAVYAAELAEQMIEVPATPEDPVVPGDPSGTPVVPGDPSGNPVVPVDPSGNPVVPVDPSGNPVVPVDPSGNPVVPVDPSGDPVTSGLLGDANEDGSVNTSDALRILRYTLGKATLTEQGMKNADVNKDTKVNTSDALRILRATLGKVEL